MSTGIAPARMGGQRDARIDFLRGLALIFIFVDHVPDSLLLLFTLRAYAFADAAELFFFLSGFVAAMVYGRMAASKGWLATVRRVWRRALVLYAAQLLLFALLAAEVWLTVAATGHGAYPHHFRLDALLTQPAAAVTQAFLLRFQPAYLDILPVYVLLLAAFPVILIGLARNVWWALVPSGLLYLSVQIWAVTLHSYPNGDGWFFNPLAWQFLFVLGASLGHPRLRGRLPGLDNVWLLRAAVLVAGAAAIFQLPEALRMIWPGIPSLAPAVLSFEKSALEPLRIVSFLALALLARRYVPAGAVLSGRAAGRLVIRCGQNSLEVFCFGVLLAVAGGIVANETGHSLAIQFAFSLAGIVAMMAFAFWLELVRGSGGWRPVLALLRRQPA